MNWIDYRSLPQVGGITELFKDYVSEFKKVQQFYELDYQTLDNFGVRCEKIRSEYRLRYDINGILLRQNKDFG
ncbi:MAG: bacillithiol biosynthesis BshC, partial [Bacteroidetes bacterium]|nr:bacillithiol biosynthesis BshC [Bacteroidota bacterium]MBU1423795.1 bacillithiol biosynthesis BshC [Bacteroidota bacterium]